MQSEAVNVDICPTPHLSSMQQRALHVVNAIAGSAANCYNVNA